MFASCPTSSRQSREAHDRAKGKADKQKTKQKAKQKGKAKAEKRSYELALSSLAMGTMASLNLSVMETKTLPEAGSFWPADKAALA